MVDGEKEDFSRTRLKSETELTTSFKPTNKAGEHLMRALRMAKSKLYQSAAVEFNQAVKLNRAEILPIARRIFNEKTSEGDHEFALSVGILLLKVDKFDYQLTTTLGGYARKVGNNTQAISLYQQALQLQPNYLPAICSLGAAMEDVPYTETEAVAAYRFMSGADLAYPQYIIYGKEGDIIFNDKFFEELTKEIVLSVKNNKSPDAPPVVEAAEGNEGLGSSKRSLRSDLVSHADFELYLEKKVERKEIKFEIVLYNLLLLELRKGQDGKRLSDKFRNMQAYLVDNGKVLPYVNIIQGLIYTRYQEFQPALDVFLEILANDRFNRYASNNAACIYKRMGNVQQAARYYIWAHYRLSKSFRSYQIEVLTKSAQDKYAARSFREAAIIFETLIEENNITSNDYCSYFESLRSLQDDERLFDALLTVKGNDKFKSDIPINTIIGQFVDGLAAKAESSKKEGQPIIGVGYLKMALQLDERITIIKEILDLMNTIDPLSEADQQYIIDLKKMMHTKLQRKENTDDSVTRRQVEYSAQRSEYLKKARVYSQQGNYNMAISMVESAFRMKNDAQTYQLLTKLYKAFNYTDKLQLLEKQYHAVISEKNKSGN